MTSDTLDRVTQRDILDAVNRLEDKVTDRLNQQDARLDQTVSRLDRIEGAVGMVKWLGPAGVVALIIGLLTMAGYVLSTGKP